MAFRGREVWDVEGGYNASLTEFSVFSVWGDV